MNQLCVHSTQYTLHTAQLTVYNAHFKLHSSQCTMYSAHCNLQTAYCTLRSPHCTLHAVHCALHTTRCTLHSALCCMYSGSTRASSSLLSCPHCSVWSETPASKHELTITCWLSGCRSRSESYWGCPIVLYSNQILSKISYLVCCEIPTCLLLCKSFWVDKLVFTLLC